MVAAAPAGTFTEIGGSGYCQWAISSGGSVEMLSTLYSVGPPSGVYTKVKCYQYGYFACALTTAGEVVCWSTTSTAQYTPPSLAGTGFIDFAVADPNNDSSRTICGLSSAGLVQCAGPGASSYQTHAPTSTGWNHISTSNGFRAVSNSGMYTYWGSTTGPDMGVCGGTGPYTESSGYAVLDSGGSVWGCTTSSTPSQQEVGYSAPIRRWLDTPGVVLTDGRLYSAGQLYD
jgi:hypothetical protein